MINTEHCQTLNKLNSKRVAGFVGNNNNVGFYKRIKKSLCFKIHVQDKEHFSVLQPRNQTRRLAQFKQALLKEAADYA